MAGNTRTPGDVAGDVPFIRQGHRSLEDSWNIDSGPPRSASLMQPVRPLAREHPSVHFHLEPLRCFFIDLYTLAIVAASSLNVLLTNSAKAAFFLGKSGLRNSNKESHGRGSVN